MKARLILMLTVFALTVSLMPAFAAPADGPACSWNAEPQAAPVPTFDFLEPQPAAAPINSCSSYCSRVRCIGDYICGPYVNSSGQTVCGCHPR